MDPAEYDWSRFELAYYYDRPVAEVFRVWATSAGLERFFLATCVFTDPEGRERAPEDPAQAGDTFRWIWRHGPTLEGEVFHATENEQFSFSFGDQSVSVFFAPCDHQTEVHLVQFDIPDTDAGTVLGHLNCRSCWIFFLVNLKSVLDAGGDLRDTDPERVSSIEVGFVPITTRS